jgi:polyferredoxin
MKRQKWRKALILISFFLFPLTFYYLSPYLIIMGAAEGVITGSFIVFAALFVSSLILGRSFCSWVCPAGGLQDICMLVNDKRHRGGWRKWLKFIIWVPWLAIITITAITAGGLVKIDPLYQTWHGLSVHSPYDWIIFYAVLILIVSLSFISGRRAFCHTVCWMAPFMVLGNLLRRSIRLPCLRLNTQASRCIDCGRCSQRCPMSLNVQDLVKQGPIDHVDCILCGECVDACPKSVIAFTCKSVANTHDLIDKKGI